MTENGLNIQTISNKRTDLQADRVLLFGKVTEKKEKANPSAKPKEPFFFNACFGSLKLLTIFVNLFR